MASRVQLNFEGLGPDIIHLICIHLLALSSGFATLRSLSGVSRICHEIAYPVLCRDIKLVKGFRNRNSPTLDRLIPALLDKTLKMRKHVRNLHVKYPKWSDTPVDPLILEQILENLELLTGFKWNSSSFIPANVLSKLEKRWPYASLSMVRNQMPSTSARWESKTERQLLDLDERGLSSPNLTSLTLAVKWTYKNYNPPGPSHDPAHSDLRAVSNIISNSIRLKRLSLWFSSGACPSAIISSPHTEEISSSQMSCFLQQPLPSDLYLPQLRSITRPLVGLIHDRRRLAGSGDHVIHALSAMLLQELSRWPIKALLKLHGLSPRLPYDELAGRCPNIVELDVVLCPRTEIHESTFEPALRFIDSINALRKLKVTNMTPDISKIWSSIDKHKASLRALVIHTAPLYENDGLETRFGSDSRRLPHPLMSSQHVRLLIDWLALRQLEIDICCEDAEALLQADLLSASNHTAHSAIIPYLTNLQSLSLNIELQEHPSAFSITKPTRTSISSTIVSQTTDSHRDIQYRLHGPSVKILGLNLWTSLRRTRTKPRLTQLGFRFEGVNLHNKRWYREATFCRIEKPRIVEAGRGARVELEGGGRVYFYASRGVISQCVETE